MKKVFKLAIWGCAAIIAPVMISCSGDDEPDGKPADKYATTTIGFENVPAYLIGGPTTYGENLYFGAQDQITTGYVTQIYDDTYAQFSINYGSTFDSATPYGYTFYAGGLAVSNWHDMTDDSYMNQLSVYNTSSPSGGNFVVAFGNVDVENPSNSTLKDYEGCARVLITDAQGLKVSNPGEAKPIWTGDDKEAFFESVYINNTTYDYMVMKNGNNFASALNEENEGWFKVQFIAFDDNEENAECIGYTEAYLANFKKGQADGYIGIIDTWTKVNLSMLPECSVLVINFVGSDMGQYGLNTPGYCALDKFEISVEK
ncbi:MAG: DUF4465 domain-containing protein [Muribaculaceae bacterium]|nr:DUF4465 domain-containing protein [Muribaculaceae bacterium]